MANYDRQYQAYQREVQSYLQKVKDGRRVPAADPQAPQFSQRADDERQAKRAGLGAFIQHGPPTPVMQPPLLSQQQMSQQQPAAPLPGGLMDWLDQKRGQISKYMFGSRGGAAPAPFETPLSPQQEAQFPAWKQQYAPKDSGADYDLRGAFKAGLQPDPSNGHWPDTYKKPNHPTFSDQSIYSSLTGTKPGTWDGDTYKPFPGRAAAPSPVWGFSNAPGR